MSSHASNSRGWGAVVVVVVVVVVGGAVIMLNGYAGLECSGVFKPFFNYLILLAQPFMLRTIFLEFCIFVVRTKQHVVGSTTQSIFYVH
jgi:hypothetical protein